MRKIWNKHGLDILFGIWIILQLVISVGNAIMYFH